MRAPQDLPHPRATRARSRRGRWWIAAAVVFLIVLVASAKILATLYTDSLWFSSVDLHSVWSTLLAVKVGLFASFGAVFFVLLWSNLAICDRLGAKAPSPDPEDELVRRYQRAIRPYAGWLHAGVALVVALIVASGTVGQWQNWLLFTHAQSFGVKDPQFGLDAGFFVFRLPFLQFLVDWTLVALVVVLVITAVFHYLNGGIRARRVAPRVRPFVKVHLSVLLALVALVKAAGYVLQRFQLDMSTNGYVEGAGYTDVHARLPALEVLFFVSLFAAVILLYNIRRQGWTLPVLAVGLWAFVALVIGVIYPAVLQALRVNPAQSTLEKPYIARNIAATRAAYGLQHVTVSTFQGSTTLPTATVDQNITTLANIRLWDPASTIAVPTFQKLQNVRSYYTFQSAGVDRYTLNGTLRPVLVGVRQINPTDLPSSSWVNTHLQYTHGDGLVLAEANKTTANGNPVFGIQDVPATSSPGYPKITQPAVYFGIGDSGYVVADTQQSELDYQKPTGIDVETHYKGSGGVEMSSFLTKLAFTIRTGTFNLLISDLLTPRSRIMFVRNIQARVKKAAPFLNFDSSPYAAVVNGQIDWIVDGYTTTAYYPYSQNADTQHVPPGTGLPSSYNYVRNSVKVVINAFTGKMTFYAMDNDPILRSYEEAFPGMFTPAVQMSPALRAHLRYPENLFSIQAAVYGRYHITSPSNFYTAGDAWTLSPTAGVGSPANALAVTLTTNAAGQIITDSYQSMAPVYQVLAEPGQRTQSLTISDAYVPAGNSSQILTAFMMAGCTPAHYGQLHVYVTPPGRTVAGPALADSYIEQSSTVSQTISLLDQHGSQVILGNVLLVPIGQSLVYVRPLYVQSRGNPQPQLKDVIVVSGQEVAMESTLEAALNKVLGTNLKSTGGSLTTAPTVPTPSTSPSGSNSTPLSSTVAEAQSDLAQAASHYAQAQKDLQAGDLGGYQSEVQAAEAATAAAEALLSQAGATAGPTSPTSTSTTTSTTTSTAPGSSASRTTSSGSTSTTSGSASLGSKPSKSTSASASTASGSTTSGTSKATSGVSGGTATGTAATSPASGSQATTTTTSPNEA